MRHLWAVFAVFVLCVDAADRLSVDKATNTFVFRGRKLFLSGVNQAWINYGHDFGNNASQTNFCGLNDTLNSLQKFGGHVNRIWLHVEGDSTPQYDSNGYVIGTDAAGSLISDLRAFLRVAAVHDVFVQFCLWNGAVLRNQKTIDLFTNQPKLQSYIDKCLVPMVTALKDEPALAGWEIMNEPEGALRLGTDSEPCFDTQKLQGSGAGWAGSLYSMKDALKFVAMQTDAIHRADPQALVTVGSWSERASTNEFGYFNYYSDECLRKAGGVTTLDYFQIHSYAWNGAFGAHAPFNAHVSEYRLNKPVVIGEFNADNNAPLNVVQQYNRIYDYGYHGAWGWTAEPSYNMWPGMESLRTKPDVSVSIGGVAPPDRCSCSDTAPDNEYTCAQQAGWGKCGETWMQGFCCRSCRQCNGCR